VAKSSGEGARLFDRVSIAVKAKLEKLRRSRSTGQAPFLVLDIDRSHDIDLVATGKEKDSEKPRFYLPKPCSAKNAE
jgi:hypothetical protein